MWDWAIWGALILAGAAGIAALALLAVRAREAWREANDTRRDLVYRLRKFAAKAEATAESIASVGDTPELRQSLARLRVSLARLSVLREALDEARLTAGRATAIVPRK
jgi:non-ribosomal peptide synthetase component F